ncbi:MAG: histidine kinase [Bacteroidetes bacterium]|nr:histidine kinase [Bacteroidota bacterium]
MLQALSIKSLILIAFVFSIANLSAINETDRSLVARFTFKDGEVNSYPLGFTAKTVGVSLIQDRFGNNNSAFYLHGNPGSYINIGTSNKLKPTNGTVAVWFKIDNEVFSGRGAAFNPIILTKSRAGDDFFEGYSILYDVASRKLGIAATFSELNQVSIRSADTVKLGKWYHLVITYDDDFLCLYINGILENKMPKNFTSRFLEGDSVMLGNSANYKNERYFNGTIDDFEIYNRVLSPEEIVQLYNAPNPNKFAIYKEIIIYTLTAICAILVIIWLVVLNYRKLIERKRAQIDISNRLLELETKSVRTQMNPHFIFNSLNTLNRFILEADLANAEIYLSKFSKLLRKLMESSAADKISLEEEIEILKGYIEIEKLRFSDSFEFEVQCFVNKAEDISIPFMLVQPFVENAIWHGLIPKKENRFLNISFLPLDENRITCIVNDNGVGREEAAKHKDPLKKKSLAIDFIKQRLELITKAKNIACYFTMTDKKDAELRSLGTKVEIIIPILR